MKYLGVKVSNGLALGKCVFVDNTFPTWEKRTISNAEEEIAYVDQVIAEMSESYQKRLDTMEKGDLRDLTEFHKMMVDAASLKNSVHTFISTDHIDGASALSQYFEAKAKELSQVDNAYLQERSKDIRDVERKIIRRYLRLPDFDLSQLTEDSILVSKEITPSILLSGNLQYVKGIVSEIGGKTSHVGILANTLELPSVFGIQDVEKKFKADEILFVDGNHGYVENELSEERQKESRIDLQKEAALKQELKEMIGKKAITRDGVSFDVTANSGDLGELDRINADTIDGIGLFRTEFLYLNRTLPPSEEYLFGVFKSFAEKLEGKPFIIRTLDIGGDKKCPYIDIPEEKNPFLGYRAIRYCLDHPEFFKESLRAILRASVYGDIWIMYPMISSLSEVRRANELLEEAKQELREKKISFNENIKVGIMIEIPAAAIAIDLFLDEIDFVSIGTNDLVQYTTAVDRINPTVSKLYQYYNPGVLRLLHYVIATTRKNPAKMVGMCGEMAADPLGILLLIGMGLQEFSVNLAMIERTKKYISLIDQREAKTLVSEIMQLKTAREVEEKLEQVAREVYGKYYE